MAFIKIDDKALDESSKKIAEKIEQLTDMKSRLSSITGAISDSWQGVSSDAYINLLHGFDDRTGEMIEILKEFENYVERSISDFRELDRKSADRIRNSF